MPDSNIHYPRTPVVSAFKKFIAKVSAVNRPAKADRSWLKTLGFSANEHTSFLTVLKFIGLLDNKGVPNADLWPAVHAAEPQAKIALAESIRHAYAPLFGVYSDAYRQDTEALRQFFKVQTGGAEAQVTQMAETFRAVADLADFTGAAPDPKVETANADKGQTVDKKPPEVKIETPTASGLALNVTIQLQLPASADGEVYDKLFAALRKHLLDLG